MKNLSNCGPREFMRQTAKIRHAVSQWLKLTDIINIRKRLPEQPDYPDSMPKEERVAKFKEWREKVSEQAKVNMHDILDAIMDEHPDETVDLLALCCFVEPEHAEEHTMSEYLGAVVDMMEDENVMRFFTSSMRLAKMAGLTD